MCFILDRARKQQNNPIKANLDGVKWGFHCHPSGHTPGDFEIMPGTLVVCQVWKTEWQSELFRLSFKSFIEQAHRHDRQIVLRIEDPALFSQKIKGVDQRALNEAFWVEYLAFLREVLSIVSPYLWGVQFYNEPFLSSMYMRGGNGERITPEELTDFFARFAAFVRSYYPNLKVVTPAMTNYHEKQYRALWEKLLLVERIQDAADVACIHCYSRDPGKIVHYYERLAEHVGSIPVLLGEVNGPHDLAPLEKWNCIEQIVSMFNSHFASFAGACIYSWQEPDFSERPQWSSKGTEVEQKVRELSGGEA